MLVLAAQLSSAQLLQLPTSVLGVNPILLLCAAHIYQCTLCHLPACIKPSNSNKRQSQAAVQLQPQLTDAM